MREKAEAQGLDLLVIDTGDRVEGNGLYDSSEPKGVYLSEILRQQHIDLLSAGNHELYKGNTSEAEFLITVPNFAGHYVASNIDIINSTTNGFVPLAPRFKKFTTPNQGIRIIGFGFIFDFTGNFNNTIVQPVEDTIKEDWFQETIRDTDVDLFLVIGHVPVRSKEFDAIFKAIRAINQDIPIQFFGGHLHIRDYARYDPRAHGLASGRFLETIGFMSIDNISTGKRHLDPSESPSFNRRYIDSNLFSFCHHTGLEKETFPTEHGRNVTALIQKSRDALQLDEVYGCVPRDLWMFRARYPGNNSIYTWLEEHVLPSLLRDGSRDRKPALSIVNSGAIRFDIFKGPFTQDTTYIVSPFTSGFRYVKDVPYGPAKLVVEILNKQPQILSEPPYSARYPVSALAFPDPAYSGDTLIDDASELHANQIPLNDYRPKIFPGYTTMDDGGSDGDDTIHSHISFYQVPNCITALTANNDTVPEMVDLVYIDFIEPHMALAGRIAGLDVDFSKDSDVYMPTMTLTSLIRKWVKDNWGCDQV